MIILSTNITVTNCVIDYTYQTATEQLITGKKRCCYRDMSRPEALSEIETVQVFSYAGLSELNVKYLIEGIEVSSTDWFKYVENV